MPVVRRTLATLRRAEFGFFGVVVYTRVQTPRRCGHPFRAGTLFREGLSWRGLRMSWLTVGIYSRFVEACAVWPGRLGLGSLWSLVSKPTDETRTIAGSPFRAF